MTSLTAYVMFSASAFSTAFIPIKFDSTLPATQVEPRQGHLETLPSSHLLYAEQVVQSINTNSLDIFGDKLVPTFNLLQNTLDEGFEEGRSEDPTLGFLLEDEADWNPPTIQASRPPKLHPLPLLHPQSSVHQVALLRSLRRFWYVNFTAVDEQNIPGMDRVDRLAEYLVELRTNTGLTLSRQQLNCHKKNNYSKHSVDDIVCLWQNLLEYDKQRVNFAARLQDRLTMGRFRSPNKESVFTPGVDSLKRFAQYLIIMR
ncbi:hypothetical protein G5714_018221 [Onychostoma macrolepis]|uniref:Uncharacterized protein n=1 Tax=Onychostoma macrolepis TaxID=369639 RepID=A0A7J6C088_9TELE|nr:hypothetical protein G5714_018221 [Onychostoma macrolepis]